MDQEVKESRLHPNFPFPTEALNNDSSLCFVPDICSVLMGRRRMLEIEY